MDVAPLWGLAPAVAHVFCHLRQSRQHPFTLFAVWLGGAGSAVEVLGWMRFNGSQVQYQWLRLLRSLQIAFFPDEIFAGIA